MSSYSVYVLFFPSDVWFKKISLSMDIDFLYYCTHFGCGLHFTLSIYVYLVACRVNIFILLAFLHTLLINFVSPKIRCKMCASRSPKEWDETFECFVDMTLGMMAIELGHWYLNRIDRMFMHTYVRTGHQYMLELLNEHPNRFFNKICMYRPCFEMLIQVLRQQTGLQNRKYSTLEEHVMIFVYIISQKAMNQMAMKDW